MCWREVGFVALGATDGRPSGEGAAADRLRTGAALDLADVDEVGASATGADRPQARAARRWSMSRRTAACWRRLA